MSDICTHLEAVCVDTSSIFRFLKTISGSSSVWQLVSTCFLATLVLVEVQVLQAVILDLLHTKGTLSLTSMVPASKKKNE